MPSPHNTSNPPGGPGGQPYGNPPAPQVSATFTMGGHTFSDVNPVARVPRVMGTTIPSVRPVNANQFTMHTEFGAMFQAHQRGLRGGHGNLIIGGLVSCSYCKGDVKTMARALQLSSLTVREANGSVISFGSPQDLLPMAQGGKGWI
jgi:hypothetical protein